MENLWLIGCAFLLGVLMRRSGRLPPETGRVLGGYIIFVSLPALVLLHIHDLEISAALLLAAAMPWLLFLPAMFLFPLIVKDREAAGALILTAGLGNTSFIGLPMIEAYFGVEVLGIGIMADQLGTFLVLSTLGTITLLRYSVAPDGSAAKADAGTIIRKIIWFPPFAALVVAFLLRPVTYPDEMRFVLESLGATLTPVALVIVGFQINLRELRGVGGYLTLGLGYKLVVAPLLIAGLYWLIVPADQPLYQISVFEAAMPPMITASILAIEHNLKPSLAAMMVGIGTPLGFVTLYLWQLILQ